MPKSGIVIAGSAIHGDDGLRGSGTDATDGIGNVYVNVYGTPPTESGRPQGPPLSRSSNIHENAHRSVPIPSTFTYTLTFPLPSFR
jgi:hypothetical protein